METIIIKTREVLKRTGFRVHRYKEVFEFIVTFNGNTFTNYPGNVANVVIPFNKVIETNNKSDLESFISRLGESDGEKQLKTVLTLGVIGK